MDPVDPETDAIRKQMEETRASLTGKLESLEQQIVETVQGATSAMTETVENVKEAVHDTVSEVKGTVQDTVETVKSTFDFQHQFEKHPWLFVGSAVALGFLAERLISRVSHPAMAYAPPPPPRQPEPSAYQQSYRAAPAPTPATHGHNGNGYPHAAQEETYTEKPSSDNGGILGMFEKEIGQFKKMAIGTTMGVVRDFLTEAVPEPMRPDVSQILDRVTTKLGGEK